MVGRVPDQGLIAGEVSTKAVERIEAIRGGDSSWAFVYLPAGQTKVEVETRKLSGKTLNAWWYDPRKGEVVQQDIFQKPDGRVFTVPDMNVAVDQADWVLVLDDASKGYGAPGGQK
jgi:hypothetical protein